MARKTRLDKLLVDRGHAGTRTEAQRLIRAGLVRSKSAILDKPGEALPEDAHIHVAGKPHPYVGRGGLKLAHALEAFGLDPGGVVAVDIGASTGGFTDCLLQRGAERVYAIDVGRNQLDWKLRSDERVVVHEGVNARNLTGEVLLEPVAALVMDVSFISCLLPLEAALPFLASGAWGVILVKPQFEAGREAVGKGGIVRDPAARAQAVEKVRGWLEGRACTVLGCEESPIQGAKGNVEYLMGFRAP